VTMLIIPDVTKTYLKETFAWAVDNDSWLKLIERLAYLDEYGQSNHEAEFRVTLYPDKWLGDHGFSVSWEKRQREQPDYNHFMAGGLVFHESDKTWGVHT
jgi:hypothetical protein